MKILFIIGNGFDLRLNLPTSYPEFLKYYKEQEPKHNIGVKTSKEKFFALMHEKQNIGNDRWKDLEVALGDFTSSFTDKAQFLDFYRDINQCLVNYLSNVEEKANPSLTNEESEYLKQSLIFPYNYLTNREKELFKSKIGWNHLHVSIISFNYTSTLEALCENTIELGKEYEIPDSSYRFMLNDIKHIHGILTTNSILLGVDNEEQISNEEFRLDEDILDVMVKPRGNENIGSLIDRECLALIQEAMVIYVFGTSLGQTDKTWWAAIKERFLANPEVTILYFLYAENSRPILTAEKASFQRRARQQFMTALGLEGNEKSYRDRIFIGLNTDMFPKRE